MHDPNAQYTENLVLHREQLSAIQSRLLISSAIRGIVFLAAIFGVYFAWSETRLAIGIAVLAIVLFLFLVSKHTDLQYRRDFLQELIRINALELRVQKRDFHELPSGVKFKDSSHAFSLDIDLFGRGSFFQYCNRTALDDGKNMLASTLTENSIKDVPQKQEAIKELAEKLDWRQEFGATTALVKTDVPVDQIINWLRTYKPFVPRIMRWLPLVFSGVSVALAVTAYLGLLPSNLLIYWFFIGLGISALFVKKVNLLSDKSGRAQGTFEQYYKLLLLLEKEDFSSEYLLAQLNEIKPTAGQKASKTIQSFSKMLGALDQRSNMLVGIVINGFMLSDLRQAYRIERWIAKHTHEVESWFGVIAFFDAQNSLGNFAFNHPKYTFPRILSGKVLDSLGAAHPLLDPEKAVASDIHIDKEEFFIVTGANMAGKSTFLRTVGIQLVMANTGLPVCAREVRYSPIKLITSMRTTDSLTDDASYFFSELKRLQYIVQAIEKDEYFIILDEILKGTNSTDKAIGSRKFINKLVASHSTGIIATHDLSLCEAAEALSPVKNYYFDARIENDELHFDYTLKEGVCQNMNASFLLQKMGIV